MGKDNNDNCEILSSVGEPAVPATQTNEPFDDGLGDIPRKI